jgi:thiamine pyrophosphokinase
MNTQQPKRLAVVVADAPVADLRPYATQLERADLRIAADGGARHWLQAGILPHVAVGDFDSLPGEMLAELEARGVRIERHSAQKDETDLELALLHALGAGATHVVVLAALGGRPDQHLANLQLLVHPILADVDVRMFHAGWEVFAIHGSAMIEGASGQTVSLLPMTEQVTGIVTDGLFYPLRDEALRLGPARGVSNVMSGASARVMIRSGILLAMHQIT